jgi:hypothetical protein
MFEPLSSPLRDENSVIRSTPRTSGQPAPHIPPRPAVILVGWLMAAWCIGFAVVNIALEGTNHLADGRYARYAAAFTVMNWLVVGLKLLGTGVALLSVTRGRPPVSVRLLGVGVWGVFATLAVYVLGSMVQAVGMASGLTGSANQIDATDIAYLIFFLTAAGGWGILAISYSTRHALRWGVAALGVLGAPVMLGFLLVAMPTVLAALGLMPAS